MQRQNKLDHAFARVSLAMLAAGLLTVVPLHARAASELLISEYIEGSGNNKAIEIYNGTGAAVDLAANGYVLQMYFNGNPSAGLTISLTGTVAPGDVHVLAHGSANAAILAQADQTNSSGWFNGDDAVVLRKGGTAGVVVDSIGQVGFDPGSEWGSGLTSTADNTLRRKAGSDEGDSNPFDTFDPSLAWDGFAVDTFDGLGSHAAGAGGNDGTAGSSQCGQPHVAVSAIQGSGPTAAITGAVTTQGVVVGDYEGPAPALRGFYIQDLHGDGDPSTSDGIFVFNGNNDIVNLGDVVRVTGTAGEFQGQTQIASVTSIEKCGTGSVEPVDVYLPLASADDLERFEGMLVRLPQTLYVTEHFQLGRFGQVVMSSGGPLMQPTHVAAPGADALALATENMLNRLIIDDELNNQNPDPIRFGRDGNPLSATNTLRVGDTTSGIVGVMTYTWSGNGASGNAYRVRPVNALGGGVPAFRAENERPDLSPLLGGRLLVASFNLLNYFNTFDGLPDRVDNCSFGIGGAPSDCRGADDAAEFERQAAKTVSAILGLEADIIGLMELENDGYGSESAIHDLIERLNAATAPGTYAYVNADAATGRTNVLGNDAIKVGLIFKSARVAPLGTAVLNSGAFGLFTTVSEGVIGRNRPALAQTFSHPDGGTFTVVVNHLKSKGSSCEGNISPVASDSDLGDSQGNCNLTRAAAAAELAEWLANDPTGSGDPDVLLIGDLNAYAMEDPITALKQRGYTNLIESLVGSGAYSYVFDGQRGYLDHALGTSSLAAQVSGVAEWHLNADEPGVLDYNTNFKSTGQIASLYAADAYRSSDHDPVVVGLDLDGQAPTLALAATPSVLWPANHKLVSVEIMATARDNLDPAPAIRLVSVTSNEADNGLGDGDTAGDIEIVDDFTLRLRAERAGKGAGRIYTLTYEARDFAGNASQSTIEVSVPHGMNR
ncbi:MAG: ExeM/NucH family extracellular endonuclease [Thiobacillus sp.]|nr:ExeM/NucH family extracellular endonuclease [Thiobacillus sp.]